jgi:hypothetical protein
MRLLPAAILALLALVGPGVGDALAQGCAMCGSALKDDPTGRAISWSVLFLIAAPYTVVGLVGGYIFYTYRRAAADRRASVIDLFRTRRAVPRPGGDIS